MYRNLVHVTHNSNPPSTETAINRPLLLLPSRLVNLFLGVKAATAFLALMLVSPALVFPGGACTT